MIDYEIVNVLVSAVEKSFKKLFAVYNENFYYCSLVIADDSVPYISAWSEEALKCFLTEKCKTEDEVEEKELLYRWSYADSPYCAYGFDDYFNDVKEVFDKRFESITTDKEYEREHTLWVNCMEKTMEILSEKGLFDKTKDKCNILINAEVMPPDSSNYKRALRLNSIEIINSYNSYFVEEDYQEKDYHSIWHPKLCDVILIQSIIDNKAILKLRKCFYYDGDLKSLLQGCANPPFMLKKDAIYDNVIETLKCNPEFSKMIKVKMLS